ncbi:MAG: cadherin domain-containing protein [Ekhidna sp.]|nr:cadherin domain-containing protein [Ekhidna sp.]
MQDFNLAAANGFPRGLWSDGTTMWVIDEGDFNLTRGRWLIDPKIYAYSLATGARDAEKDINNLRTVGNTNPKGLWSDGTTMWVADSGNDQLYAYTLATGARDDTKEFNLHADNRSPRGLWSDGTTMWVAGWVHEKLYAYTLATELRNTSKEFNLHADNGSPRGLWSDGTTMWVVDDSDDQLYAYTLATGARDDTKEFNLHADNRYPRGLWSDGTTMWVVDSGNDQLYAYVIETTPWFHVSENVPNAELETREGQTTDTLLGASDPDEDDLTYELTGTGSEDFAIDDMGKITVARAGGLDREGRMAAYYLEVNVSDGTTTTRNLTIFVTDVNESPAFVSGPFTRTIAEDASVGYNVGSVIPATDPENDKLTYILTAGNEDGNFAIDEDSGQITVASGASLDYEGSTSSYTLTVTATDATGSNTAATTTVTVTVTDVNDTAPALIVSGTARAEENSTGTGLTVTATDVDGTDESITYTFTGDAVFSIDPSTGILTFTTAPDYENPGDAGTDNTYEVQVTATDGTNTSDPQTLTVTVTDVNEHPPVITSAPTASVQENSTTVLTVAATDEDGTASIMYAVSGGADMGSFSIDASSGSLTFQSAPDYENPGDAGTDNTYEVQVTASDGTNTSDPQAITVTVTDVNDNAPVITSASTASVQENSTIVLTVAATDDDGTASIMYAVSGGADMGSFSIGASSGSLTFQSAPDYENPGDANTDNVYEVQVTASDGTNTSNPQTITVTVTDVNDVLGVPSAEGVELYPNPATDHFSLSGTSNDWVGVSLMNTSGQAVRSYPVAKDGLYDLSGLREGIFFVFMEGEDGKLKSAGRIVIRK